MKASALSRCFAAVLLAGSLLLASPSPLANPLPDMGMLADVRPEPYAATTCEELIQHTFDSGPQVFTGYYYPWTYPNPEVGILHLIVEFTWPEGWALQGSEVAHGGSGTLIPLAPNHYRLDWTWPECPRITWQEAAFQVASFTLDVAGEGEFVASCYYSEHCYPAHEIFDMPYGMEAPAHAGVACAYCDQRCDLGISNRVRLSEDLLVLEARAGESAAAEIGALLDFWHYPATYDIETTAEWLGLEITEVSSYELLLALTANASQLDAGTYEAYVRATAECVDCARVVFNVLPAAQGVGEEGPPVSASWGRVKRIYQRP